MRRLQIIQTDGILIVQRFEVLIFSFDRYIVVIIVPAYSGNGFSSMPRVYRIPR